MPPDTPPRPVPKDEGVGMGDGTVSIRKSRLGLESAIKVFGVLETWEWGAYASRNSKASTGKLRQAHDELYDYCHGRNDKRRVESQPALFLGNGSADTSRAPNNCVYLLHLHKFPHFIGFSYLAIHPPPSHSEGEVNGNKGGYKTLLRDSVQVVTTENKIQSYHPLWSPLWRPL